MTPLRTLAGSAAPLWAGIPSKRELMANVDTDAIIPKQFLKTLTRTGLARGLFHDMKYLPDGNLNPNFVLNQTAWRNSAFLIAGENFGCGSSREHAPWALLDQGIRCVIAPSFADIFANNCFKNSIAPIPMPADTCQALAHLASGTDKIFSLDLTRRRLTDPAGKQYSIALDAARAQMLIDGLDDIGLTLRYAADIADFEKTRNAHPLRSTQTP